MSILSAQIDALLENETNRTANLANASALLEIVLPLIKDGKKIGVLDIDSPELDRFSAEDEALLSEFVETLCKHL